MLSGSRRTVLMLAGCRAGDDRVSIVGTTGAIVSNMLTDKTLSTLPIAVQMTGMMCATIGIRWRHQPAQRLLDRPQLRCRARQRDGGDIGQLRAVLWHVLYQHPSGFTPAHSRRRRSRRFARRRSRWCWRAVVSAVLARDGEVVACLFAPAMFAGCYAMIMAFTWRRRY
jgi:hypothetical protein